MILEKLYLLQENINGKYVIVRAKNNSHAIKLGVELFQTDEILILNHSKLGKSGKVLFDAVEKTYQHKSTIEFLSGVANILNTQNELLYEYVINDAPLWVLKQGIRNLQSDINTLNVIEIKDKKWRKENKENLVFRLNAVNRLIELGDLANAALVNKENLSFYESLRKKLYEDYRKYGEIVESITNSFIDEKGLPLVKIDLDEIIA